MPAFGLKDWEKEDPNYQITITRSDGDDSIRPQVDENWQFVPEDEDSGIRWRGFVGSLVAAQAGYCEEKLVWHLSAWPDGYTLWRQQRRKKELGETPRWDYYLYGSPKGRFRSPIEFVLHAFRLLSDEEYAEECKCTVCTGRKQGEIDLEYFNHETHQMAKKNAANRRANAGGTTTDRGQSRRTGATGHQGNTGSQVLDMVKYVRQQIREKLNRQPCEARRRDQAVEQFRKFEMVWAPLPPNMQPDPSIRYWPGIIEDHVPGAENLVQVVLLGDLRSPPQWDVSSLLPFYGYPLPNIPPNLGSGATSSQLTRALRRAMWSAVGLNNRFLLVEDFDSRYIASDGSSCPRFEGCWVGAEVLWKGDFVRLHMTWESIVELANLSENAIPADVKKWGALMKIEWFYYHHKEVHIHGNIYGFISRDSRSTGAHRRNHPFEPPKDLSFWEAPLAIPLHVPITKVAGRYYSMPFMQSKLTAGRSLAEWDSMEPLCKPPAGVQPLGIARDHTTLLRTTRATLLNETMEVCREVS